jgi:hypothetical protein
LDASYLPGKAGPARPLASTSYGTPVALQQQHPHLNSQLAGPAVAPVADIEQLRTDEQTAGETAEPLQGARWLACCYKAGQLGLAAYDRINNEVRHRCLDWAALAGPSLHASMP